MCSTSRSAWRNTRCAAAAAAAEMLHFPRLFCQGRSEHCSHSSFLRSHCAPPSLTQALLYSPSSPLLFLLLSSGLTHLTTLTDHWLFPVGNCLLLLTQSTAFFAILFTTLFTVCQAHCPVIFTPLSSISTLSSLVSLFPALFAVHRPVYRRAITGTSACIPKHVLQNTGHH